METDPSTSQARAAGSEALHAASELAQTPSLERALEAVRDFLGMEVAYATEHVEGVQVFRAAEGDLGSFGLQQPIVIPLELTFCQRILDGRLPNLIPDIQNEDRARSLPIVEQTGVGAFASVPLHFSDGRLFGTLCAASRAAREPFAYRDLEFLHVFARMVADQFEQGELRAANRELELQSTAATAVLAAVEARDAYTGEHSHAVVEHAVGVAEHLGLTPEVVADVRQVALLHDIGKLAIPDAILNKPGPLTPDEWEQMRRHPLESERIIRALPGLQHLAIAIRAEHERWDGDGYPDRLAGTEIPLASRITLVCDAYHAMVSDRPYRAALPEAEARRRLAAGRGTQFCPTSVDALLAILPE